MNINSRKDFPDIGLMVMFLAGIFIFAILAGKQGFLFYLSFTGLVPVLIAVGLDIRKGRNFKEIFGLISVRGIDRYFIPLAILTSFFFSMLYRDSLKLDIFPFHFTSFAIVAALVGSTEEIVFRGYVQNHARRSGLMFSVIIAAMSHTIYKLLLFSSLTSIGVVNMQFLFFWTLVIGLALGLMKEFSGSCWIPVLFHAVFDIVVYGDGALHPWWVFA